MEKLVIISDIERSIHYVVTFDQTTDTFWLAEKRIDCKLYATRSSYAEAENDVESLMKKK